MSSNSDLLTVATIPLLPADPQPSKTSRRCRFEGCVRMNAGGGFCIRHGGGKQCPVQDCKKIAQRGGFCRAHGGGSKCSVKDCTKVDAGGGFCRAHGGGKRCTFPHCTKSAVGHKLCTFHGGGVKCTEHGCTKNDQGGGKCRRHGGGKRCKTAGCVKMSSGNTGRCSDHGGTSVCGFPKCRRLARGEKADYCKAHSAGASSAEFQKSACCSSSRPSRPSQEPTVLYDDDAPVAVPSMSASPRSAATTGVDAKSSPAGGSRCCGSKKSNTSSLASLKPTTSSTTTTGSSCCKASPSPTALKPPTPDIKTYQRLQIQLYPLDDLDLAERLAFRLEIEKVCFVESLVWNESKDVVVDGIFCTPVLLKTIHQFFLVHQTSAVDFGHRHESQWSSSLFSYNVQTLASPPYHRIILNVPTIMCLPKCAQLVHTTVHGTFQRLIDRIEFEIAQHQVIVMGEVYGHWLVQCLESIDFPAETISMIEMPRQLAFQLHYAPSRNKNGPVHAPAREHCADEQDDNIDTSHERIVQYLSSQKEIHACLWSEKCHLFIITTTFSGPELHHFMGSSHHHHNHYHLYPQGRSPQLNLANYQMHLRPVPMDFTAAFRSDTTQHICMPFICTKNGCTQYQATVAHTAALAVGWMVPGCARSWGGECSCGIYCKCSDCPVHDRHDKSVL